MNKKIILSAIVFLIISTLSIFCFAEASNNTNTSNTVDLKGEITESLDKTRNTATNVTNGVVSGAGSVMNTVTNGINDMTGMNNGTNNRATMNTTNTNNNNGNYNTTRTAVGDAYYAGGNQMDTTTWLWLILAIVAIIIVGAVWYYAMQGTNNRNSDH